MGKRGKMAKNKLGIGMEASPMPRTKDDEARERKYKAEDALRTLQRADECRQDKGLMKDVKALAKEQMETAKKFAK